MTFSGDLTTLLRARFPVLYIETHEEQRALEEIRAVALDSTQLRTARKVFTWSHSDGLNQPGETASAGSRNPADALASILSTREPAVFVFKDLHAFLGEGGRPADALVVRRIRDVAAAFKEGEVARTLILISPVLRLPVELEKDVTVMDFSLPSESEILNVLEEIIEMNKSTGRVSIEVDDRGRERLAKAATGLTVTEAENAFARAMVNDGKLTDEDIALVLDEKRQTIRKSGLLDYVPIDVHLDEVGGLENLKKWLLKRSDSWLDEARAYGLPSPKGVLITGVPGCGKSMTAKAIAAAWQLPLLRLDIGRVFAGLVGSSEQNMRTAIKTAEAIAPCVLWIDEIEKGFSGTSGNGDSGTTARVFGSFLTWMQDKTKTVFVIATANNIDRLPPEFMRKGRFDEIFFVDLPTAKERRDIWQLHIDKRRRVSTAVEALTLSDGDYETLAEITEGYSGAEIEQAVIAALFDVYSTRGKLTLDDLVKSARNMVPLSVTQAEDIATIRQWADVRAVAASLSPEPASSTNSETREVSARGGRKVDI